MIQTVTHDVQQAQPPGAVRRSPPARTRSPIRQPQRTHELDAVNRRSRAHELDAVSRRRTSPARACAIAPTPASAIALAPASAIARAPASAIAPAPSPAATPRRCACGGLVGPSGECAACRAKREQGSVAAAPDRALATSREGAAEEDPTMIDDVVATNALACYGTGAVSVCNPSTGNYDITGNTNTCASRSCSQRHEERHVSDLGPCCRKLKNAISAGGDRNTLVGQYNTWMNGGAHAWTECNAYGVSLSCVSALMTSNNCATATSTTCDELRDYQTDMTAQRTSWCARAPSALPACPFT